MHTPMLQRQSQRIGQMQDNELIRHEMKIVSYNISKSKPWKIEHLLGMNADVLVVPEITCPEDASLPESYEMRWRGIEYFYHGLKWKGLGIIWKKGAGFIPEWYNQELDYAIPLVIGDFLILGIWPTKPTDGRKKIEEEHSIHFRQ